MFSNYKDHRMISKPTNSINTQRKVQIDKQRVSKAREIQVNKGKRENKGKYKSSSYEELIAMRKQTK